MNMLLNALISTGIILNLISEIDCGCYQKRLCCPGRNLTCVGFEDGIEHLPIYRTHLQNPAQPPTSTSSTSTSTSTSTTDPPTVHFVYDSLNVETRYPDTLIEQPEGSGNDYYAKYGEQIPIDEMPFEPTEFTIPFQRYGTTLAPSFKKIVFGEPFFASEHPPEIMRLRRDGSEPIAKENEYSLLSRHIPIMIGDLMDYEDPIGSGQLNQSRLRFLGSNPENICYCDEVCIAFGDCCSDYTFVCPPSDCYVTNWSEWSACVLDDTAQKCGVGTRTRTREVRREANYGGAPCPELVEQLSCFHECPSSEQDVTTVALLLDYKYNDIREKLSRDNIYWDLPEVASKVEKLSYYCVEYEIGWVNRNCIDKKITSKLHEGNKICAECQPEAQLHRNDMRCASDLNDDEFGFWKLIGPKSCNGIWKRLSRTENCKCGTNFPNSDSFLLV